MRSPEFVAEQRGQQSSHHATVDLELFGSTWVISKRISGESYNGITDSLGALYLTYRDLVRGIYSQIPPLVKLGFSEAELVIYEQYVPGYTAEQLVSGGDSEGVMAIVDNIFLPLIPHIGKPDVVGGIWTRNYPLPFAVDIKPANIVLTGQNGTSRAVPVDFFPPLIRDAETGLYPHAKSLSVSNHIEYSYGDFEVWLAKFYMMMRHLNPSLTHQLTEYYLAVCDQCDRTGMLRQRILTNIVKRKVACPNCPYCNPATINGNSD